MTDRDRIRNGTVLAWIISSMSSMVMSLDSKDEGVSVNRAKPSWVRFSPGYVRCFCNLPQCVSTGYMCKSNRGSCFSNFLDHVGHNPQDYRGRHGCVELLSDQESSDLCEPTPSRKGLIFCCQHDMCNHVDSPQTKDLLNTTLLLAEPPRRLGDLQRAVDYSDSQVWFRAATIAVPVCGAVILFVLIALAVKILRNENQSPSTRKLYEQHQCENAFRQKCVYYREEPEGHRYRMPLLIQNEIGVHRKNETNAKQEMGEYKEVILDIEKAAPKCSRSNLVENADEKCLEVKLAVTR